MSEFTYIEGGEQEQFPSLEQLTRYLNGEMSEQERKEMESKMVDDPLFADVIEGLNQMPDSMQMNQAVARIKTASRKRLLEKSKPKLSHKRKSRVQPKTFTQLSLSIAAGISLLLVSVWLVREMVQVKQSMQNESALVQEKNIASSESPQQGPEQEESVLQLESNEEKVNAPLSVPDGQDRPTDNEEKIIALEERIEQENSPSDDVLPIEPLLETTPSARQEPSPTPSETSPTTAGRAVVIATPSTPAPANKPVDPEPILSDTVSGSYLNSNSPENQDKLKPAEGEPLFSKEALAEIQEHPLEKDTRQKNSIPAEDRSRKSKKYRRNQKKEEGFVEKHDVNYKDVPPMTREEMLKAKVGRVAIIADLLVEADSLYQVGNYELAKIKLAEALQSSPGNESAMYLMGRNYRAMNQPKKGVQYLKPLLENPSSQVYFEVRWELANGYLDLGKTRPARRILESLIVAPNIYKDQAIVKLDSLENN